jgi:hypothetical protein
MNRLIRHRHQDDAFYQALVETARWLDERPWTVDYGQRRRSPADLITITDLDWQWACSTSGVDIDGGPGRRHASAWIWCALTGGLPTLAPNWPDRDHSDNGQGPIANSFRTTWPRSNRRSTRSPPPSCNVDTLPVQCAPTFQAGPAPEPFNDRREPAPFRRRSKCGHMSADL